MSLHPAGRDRLLKYIGQSEFAQQILTTLQEDGYIILPDVFSQTEVDAEYRRMWSWVETVCPTIQQNVPDTWRAQQEHVPWPCSQRDMMQLHQAGWLFSDLRELMAERVYEKLYGTKELHSSKDGFTLLRPTAGDSPKRPNDHFDQGFHLKGLQCIQGSIALTDQEDGAGCFLCWPGSHKHHDWLMQERGPKGGRKDFVILTDDEKDYLVKNGIQPLRVPVKRGTVILWRSDLVHKGAPPVGRVDTFRAVVYICMLPAALTPDSVYAEKEQAYLELKTGSHWPCQEEWFIQHRSKQADVRPYFKTLPVLTERQRLLYGLQRYAASPPQKLDSKIQVETEGLLEKSEDGALPAESTVENSGDDVKKNGRRWKRKPGDPTEPA